jgi:tetratricopeptide (TPR) repeat protein
LALLAAKTIALRTAFSMLGEVLNKRLEISGDFDVAVALEIVQVPQPTVSLCRVAEWTIRTLLKRTDNEELRAMLLTSHGARLDALNRKEDALAAHSEASKIYRRLADAHPETFLPDLAMSLYNVSIALSDLGKARWEEALDVSRKSVQLNQQIVQNHPNQVDLVANLGMSLFGLSNRLRDLGHKKEALKVARQAVNIYKQLVTTKPEVFLPHFAGSLRNLGLIFLDLDHPKDSLNATRKATNIFRKLAETNPDAFLPELAKNLDNYGALLILMGCREKALEALREAKEYFQRLAQTNPDVFLSEVDKYNKLKL